MLATLISPSTSISLTPDVIRPITEMPEHGVRDDDSLCGDHHDLIILVDRLGTDQVSGLFGNLIAFDTLAAAELYGKLCHRRPFAHAVFGYDKEIVSLRADLHARLLHRRPEG